MAFGAIFGLRVVRWLLVLRDARLRVGIEATQAELGRDLARRATRSILPWTMVTWYLYVPKYHGTRAPLVPRVSA